MTADGEVMTLSRDRDADMFTAACLSLGALGVILTVTVQCEKAFNLSQTQYSTKLDDVRDTFLNIIIKNNFSNLFVSMV